MTCDWLGTERMRAKNNGSVDGTFTSLPFGDAQATIYGSDLDQYHFAGLDRDPGSYTDHAQFRQYSNVQGHWLSPDPYGGSYDFSNPQSFNRYAYVLNSPLIAIDPLGLEENQACPIDWNCFSGGDILDSGFVLRVDSWGFAYDSGWTDKYDPRWFFTGSGGNVVLADGGGAPNNDGYVSVLDPHRTRKMLVNKLCGNSPEDPVKRQMSFGAIRGAAVGAYLGATGGGGLSFGLGAVPGAFLGAFVVGTVGAGSGVLTGGAVALGCAIGGVYP